MLILGACFKTSISVEYFSPLVTGYVTSNVNYLKVVLESSHCRHFFDNEWKLDVFAHFIHVNSKTDLDLTRI